MKNYWRRFFKNFDWLLLGSVFFLLVIGLAVLYSTTYDFSFGSEAVKQTFNIGLGLLVLFLFSRFDYRIFKNYSGILYVTVIVLLVSVSLFGFTALGAKRWIDLGFFQFQPSLVSQLLMAIILAKYFTENYEELIRFRYIIKSLIYVIIPTVLVALQPDLGTAFVFVFTWLVMLVTSRVKKRHLIILALLGLAVLPLSWPVLKDYQKERVITFLNPTADPMGSGWNVRQAIIAIGSGQLWGRGLGRGTQSQLNFIPEKHTDFVFASLGEELGFVGIFVTITLYALFFYRGIRIVISARDFFGTYLSVGMLSIIFVHTFINIGMNMGLMPVTGIPLPFISYGGTPVLVDLGAVGLLISISRHGKKIDFE